MPWCPKCQAEYRDGYTVCADCGSELIDLPDNNDKAQISSDLKKRPLDESKQANEVLLANINDAVELSYLTSMLQTEDISYRIIAKELSQYMYIIHGRCFLGKCLYVNSDDVEEAQNILKSYKAGFTADDELNADETKQSSQLIAQKIFTLFYLIYSLVFIGTV